LRELGIAPERYVQVESLDRQRGLESAHALLAEEPRPTAIFACSDQQAAGVLSACTERGLRCPEDVSVIGFDDIPLAAMTTPRLSTVQQPIQAIADAAVRWTAAGGLIPVRWDQRLRRRSGATTWAKDTTAGRAARPSWSRGT
jgi:DNA-binding LacI/PurR family transcriptional regulator